MGFTGSLLNWFADYLFNRKMCVCIEGHTSPWFDITAGVPQESIIGPLLFLLFVNDIENDIESDIHLYADDTALVESFSRSEEDEAFSLLNRDLQKLDEWSHTWNMSFNAQKSVYTIITNKRNQQQKPVLMMNNVILENVEHHKHLGINISRNLSWDEHMNTDKQIK